MIDRERIAGALRYLARINAGESPKGGKKEGKRFLLARQWQRRVNRYLENVKKLSFLREIVEVQLVALLSSFLCHLIRVVVVVVVVESNVRISSDFSARL